MASSEQSGGLSTSSDAPLVNGSQKPLKEQKGPGSSSKPLPEPARKPGAQPVSVSKDAKPSGAELKKKAKEEKAARRAKEKQEKQGTTQVTAPAEAPTVEQSGTIAPMPTSNSATGAPKQHKGTGSAGANAPKQLPIRKAEPQAAALPAPSKEKTKQVALFSHLYSGPRRTTIAGAGKDVHPAVLALGIQISHYRVIGSNARCVAMLLAFKRVIEAYTTPPGTSLPRHLTSHLSSQIEYLISCRPLSVSMGNAIRWLKVKISEVDPDTVETTAKAALCASIDNFITERVTVADKVIATSTAERIRDEGEVILTYGRSSAVQLAVEEALRQGKNFRVIVVDSRPLFEGKALASSLADRGLEVQYSLLHGLSHIIKNVTKVLLGAQAMTSNGRLCSRAGTALVAMMAKEANIPVIVCCESVKFSERVALDSIVMNEIAPPEELILQQGEARQHLEKWEDVPNLQLLNLMYDLTPANYIDMVITEYGSLPPSSVPVVYALSIAS